MRCHRLQRDLVLPRLLLKGVICESQRDGSAGNRIGGDLANIVEDLVEVIVAEAESDEDHALGRSTSRYLKPF